MRMISIIDSTEITNEVPKRNFEEWIKLLSPSKEEKLCKTIETMHFLSIYLLLIQ